MEIQTCSDKVFLDTLLNSKQSVDTVVSDSDTSSISDLDCSAVMNMPDTSDVVDNKISDEADVRTGSQQASLIGTDGSNVQTLVNQQILQQPKQIGTRLDKLENKECKKASDPKLVKSSKKLKTSSPKHKSHGTVVKQQVIAGEQVTIPNIPDLVELRQNATIQANLCKSQVKHSETFKYYYHKILKSTH